MNKFLPISKDDMIEKNWDQLDFIMVTGDAYVDHPSFGVSIISRVLESRGYKVGIIAQPNWKTVDDFKKLGEPKYGFLVTSGNIDSMVNHYTTNKKRRSKDAYSPGGRNDLRPDRAVMVYSNKIREAYKNTNIMIGGLEASLRRFGHYDYWSNKVRRSILHDANADLLMFGMGEKTVVEIAEALEAGIDIKDITYINGTMYKANNLDNVYDYIELPDFNVIKEDKRKFMESFIIQKENMDNLNAKVLVEKYNEGYVVQNLPSETLTELEMDDVYKLPFTRTYHPVYEKDGGIPAIKEVKYSLVSNRGCYGNCNFCAITFHQGRTIQARSHESIIGEAKELIKDKDFKGYIHDVGGPTANFRHKACKKQEEHGVCKKKDCLFPSACKNLIVDHKDYMELLRKLRSLEGIKKVFVRSGLRYDYLMLDKNFSEFLNEFSKHHISGQLKVAPEHISDNVLKYMGKPSAKIFDRFKDAYFKVNKKLGKEQFLVPYFISSHPGSTLKDAIALAEYIRDLGYTPEQVQDFYPTPGTLSTCMYYTELDPDNFEKIYVPKSYDEKNMQRALMQYRRRENYKLVKKALIKEDRYDLIGKGKKCLIKDS
ncbi:MAG: YgiQ family radical SAM protein [Clostridia bacterium]|jgi:uncharacterized radical SAM protein YgiQ|nr:YgiQ family radical SAM protein [Clostridia bacterium]